MIVIGAGITGLTTAYELKQAGKKVAVIEKDTIAAGTTGRTTGKVTSQHGVTYNTLIEKYGHKTAKAYAAANQAGVERVKEIIRREAIDCDWEQDSSFVFTATAKNLDSIRKEAMASQELGLPASFVTNPELPFETKGAVKFTNQGKFHSVKYLIGLAKAVDGHGSYIFENSRAIGVNDGSPCSVRTTEAKVTASDVVLATHIPPSPLVARFSYALAAYPTESFAIAGPLKKPLTGMYISPDDNHFSFKSLRIDRTVFLVVVGAGGNIPGFAGDSAKRYQRLASYAGKHFNLKEVTHHWSDMDYIAYDQLPLVGPLYPWSKHVYTATGYKKWGLSNGTVAARILTDTILGQHNDWAEVYRTNRKRVVAAMPRTLLAHFKGKK